MFRSIRWKLEELHDNIFPATTTGNTYEGFKPWKGAYEDWMGRVVPCMQCAWEKAPHWAPKIALGVAIHCARFAKKWAIPRGEGNESV